MKNRVLVYNLNPTKILKMPEFSCYRTVFDKKEAIKLLKPGNKAYNILMIPSLAEWSNDLRIIVRDFSSVLKAGKQIMIITPKIFLSQTNHGGLLLLHMSHFMQKNKR